MSARIWVTVLLAAVYARTAGRSTSPPPSRRHAAMGFLGRSRRLTDRHRNGQPGGRGQHHECDPGCLQYRPRRCPRIDGDRYLFIRWDGFEPWQVLALIGTYAAYVLIALFWVLKVS